MEIMGAIFKVIQEIAKAASTARRNEHRCRELAKRVRTVGDLLRDSTAATDTATRKRVLGRLRDTLADALKLVNSCRRGEFLSKFLGAGRNAAKFYDVNKRIDNCLMDLCVANGARLERLVNYLAARGNHSGTNAKGGLVSTIHMHKGGPTLGAWSGGHRSSIAGGPLSSSRQSHLDASSSRSFTRRSALLNSSEPRKA